MMPVKKMLEMKVIEPLPPLLVIDEATIKNFKDVNPYCECFERYKAIENYKPFIPGGVNPYQRRRIPGGDELEVYWIPQGLDWKKVNSTLRPVAKSKEELPKCYRTKKEKLEDLAFIRLPKHVNQEKI